MRRLVIAAVPEQVNIPLLLCQEQGIFARHGIEVEHRVVPEGTGKMLDLLESGEVDVALTVTDGFIAGRAGSGRRVKMVGTFVESPLVWAVACSGRNEASATLTSLGDLSSSSLGRALRFGISRLGSGSHTMGVYSGKHIIPVSASAGGGELEAVPEFVVANNFQGLRDGTHRGDFDVFMWETFTTKPFFDSGELRKVGDVPTPWSAFSFVCSTARAAGDEDSVASTIKECLFPALRDGVAAFVGEAALDRICADHGHQRQDAALWLASCKYAVGGEDEPFAVNLPAIAQAVAILQEVGLVPAGFRPEELLT